ncbi:MAG: hypothetical protein IKK99_04880 [Oscillospiraceae bacterium]|nr:hypothetical protein [Oscillospiraceae bacterium]
MKTRLDTTAIVHTARMNENNINAYRISITMDHIVNPQLLQQAVDNTISRYPMICCRMVEDGYWFYSEGLDSLKIIPDTLGVLGSITHKNVYQQAMNIIYKDDRIVLEAFHSVTDGHGAFTYINTLLYEYLRLKNSSCTEQVYYGIAPEAEYEDGFVVHSTNPKRPEKITEVISAFAFEKENTAVCPQFTTYRLNLKEMKNLAKSHRCTLNELALIMVYNSIFGMKSSEGKDVVLAVPINLRNKFQSQSLRNFIHLAKISLRKKETENSMESMVKEIRRQLHLQNNKEYLHKAISQYGRLQKSYIMSIAPLWVKNLLIKVADLFNYDKSCMTVSNLGDVSHMLPEVAQNIKFVDTMLAPRMNSPYNCCLATLGNYMNITFTHSNENDHFITGIDSWLKTNNISYTTYVH